MNNYNLDEEKNKHPFQYYGNVKEVQQGDSKFLLKSALYYVVDDYLGSVEQSHYENLGCVGCTCVSFKETYHKIGTNLVRLETKYLKDIGLSNASLSYTYTGLDKLYGDSGYEISCYYMMGEKVINNV